MKNKMAKINNFTNNIFIPSIPVFFIALSTTVLFNNTNNKLAKKVDFNSDHTDGV